MSYGGNYEEQLPHLLKLLDDDSAEIQTALQEQFAQSDGDISDHIAALGIDLSPEDQARLSSLLRPSKRQTLMDEWSVSQNLNHDSDSFEHLLRLISEFLHDGISLRSSLTDMLDILADEALTKLEGPTANSLRRWLFEGNKFKGNKDSYYANENSDLTWVMENKTGNPISLACVFVLVARRLDLDVTGCNYPGHFLARIYLDGQPHLVDCYNKGKLIPVRELLDDHKEISDQAKAAIHQPCSHADFLLRILRNLEHSFALDIRTEDNQLMQRLQSSLP